MVTDNAELNDRKRVKTSPDLPFSRQHRCVTVEHGRALRTTLILNATSVARFNDSAEGEVKEADAFKIAALAH